MLSGKWRPFCLSLNVLTDQGWVQIRIRICICIQIHKYLYLYLYLKNTKLAYWYLYLNDVFEQYFSNTAPILKEFRQN